MQATRALCLILLLIVMSRTTEVRGDDATVKPADLRVLDTGGPSPREMLHRYLLDQVGKRFDARRKAIAAIKTPQDIAARRRAMRAFFLRAIGDMPPRSPLNARVVGTLRREGYRVEKVIFESRPRHHVTANFYVPGGEPPFPGVLLPCGHSDEGKAYESYQRMAILLARNGMAVLCYDPIGQGERYQRLDDTGKPVIRGTTEHTMAGIGALLVGREEASYRIWDGMRALDYLEGRSEVDPRRLGCTGNSGGGTMTAYLMALDDRIAVAVPSCYITSLERLFATIGPQDAEQNITGQVEAGMEHADYVIMRAPKPTLLSVGTRDFFDIRGSWDTFREVKLIYGRLGFGERVDLFESDEPHGFTRARRIATVRWMSRWLRKRDEAIEEPDSSINSVDDLRCTAVGQVLREFPGEKSVFDLNAERADELRSARESANPKPSDAEFRATVRRLIGLEGRTIEPASLRVVGTVETRGRSIRKLVFQIEPGIVVPALDIAGEGHAPKAPVIVKVGVDWSRGLDDIATTPGRSVLIQPRGMGETSPGDPSGGHGPFGNDWKEAFLALHLARPLLGQRVVDVLAVVEALRAEQTDGPGFHLVGIGEGGPIALHAALLDDRDRFAEVTLEHSLSSWHALIEQGMSRDQMASVVPGALASYDLPDLATRLAPRPDHIKDSVDANGMPLEKSR